MAQLIVKPSEVKGKIEAQPSKSYTHRLLSVALLADGVSKIKNPLWSFDTQATAEAVRALGGEIEEVEEGCRVKGTGGDLKPKTKEIDVRNSGTTLRFMSAISALSPKKIRLTGDESILQRPMGPLISSLSDLGADARCEGKKERPPVVVGGGLDGGETRITGAVSSQFISALLLASPYSETGVDLEVEEKLRSKPYVEMTLEVLKLAKAGIQSKSSLLSYNIPGEQTFAPIDCSVPGDFSSAAFILGAGALSEGGVKVENLDPEGVQGDKRIIDLLKDFGAEVKVKNKTIKVKNKGRLSGIDVDCSDIPDLTPILAVLGATADGQTRLHNVPHLRFKEVDRLKVLATGLKKFGVQIKELEDGLKIFGSDSLTGAEVDSYGDHRMAMSFAVAGLAAENKVKIEGAESIGVSYPDFVKDMEKLGAKIKIKE
ncbi:hypothetical protein AKJ53_00125 [candidate division MSBL1 archaeon SCGC-AAA382F02]|uniref:3-phosphoshikimate 1-carboxyvinyltransferase n=1 Tax=candidate division MSBL1 archaeon SCGC-AAA382F02 TaxID=1698282 RepID=A0A133VJA2_9EURY|nr:hypothetical protein AKJ53_00125 [candidate division MSBL1 archaeon SCGC-AAA382F02]